MSKADRHARMSFTAERVGIPGVVTAAVFGCLAVTVANHLALWIIRGVTVQSPDVWVALVLDALGTVTLVLSFILAYVVVSLSRGPQDGRSQVLAAVIGTLLTTVIEAAWLTWSPFIRIAGIFLVVELIVLFSVAAVSYGAALLLVRGRVENAKAA